MNKKELIENFLDNRSFRIPVEDLDVARNALGLLINSVKDPLLKALEEITKGEGAYDMDKLKHASNTIDNMKELAIKAIRDSKE